MRRFVEFYFLLSNLAATSILLLRRPPAYLQSHNVIPNYASCGQERDVFTFSSDANGVGKNGGKP